MGRFLASAHRHLGALTLALALIGGPAVAAADEMEEDAAPPAESEWEFGLAPYLWTAGLSGQTGAFGAPPVNVHLSSSEVLSDLELALMLVGEARKGRWGLFVDTVYSDLSSDSTNTPGPLFGSANVDSTLFFITPMIEYQAIDNGWAELYPMAGVRVWNSETRVNFSAGLLNGRTFSDDATWVDPAVGLRGRLMLDHNLWLVGWGMVGGFGVDHDQFMWDVMGGVSYEAVDWASVVLGYRATGADYSNDGYVFDASLQGPYLGAVFRF